MIALFDSIAALAMTGDALEAEIRLAFVADGIRATFGRQSADVEQDRPDLADALRAYLDARRSSR